MSRTIVFLMGAASVIALVAGACTAKTSGGGTGGFDATTSATTSTASDTGGSSSSRVASSTSGLGGSFAVSVTVSASSGPTCVKGGPNDDEDHDGWTPAEGDCDDCNPAVNPGAIDVPPMPDGDGGMTKAVDANCDGKIQFVEPCDDGLALDDVDPMDGAKSIELCQSTTPSSKLWGVLSARYVRADGTPATLDLSLPQVGIQSNFGPNVNVQGGKNMLLLSAGTARTPTQPGACGSESCPHPNGAGNPPPGFPAMVPGCDGDSNINDDIGLDLSIRAPSNATGYKFNFKFYSFEFPVYVCTSFNDQFIALVQPNPMGSMNGNIAFDSMKNPVSVNIGFFDVCDPNSIQGYTNKTPPNPYCPSGPAQLEGTGFDIWGGAPPSSPYENSGATSWLETQAPVSGNQEFDIRFAIWNTGDEALFSSVLVDNWQWILTPGVSIDTTPVTNPK